MGRPRVDGQKLSRDDGPKPWTLVIGDPTHPHPRWYRQQGITYPCALLRLGWGGEGRRLPASLRRRLVSGFGRVVGAVGVGGALAAVAGVPVTGTVGDDVLSPGCHPGSNGSPTCASPR